MLLAFEEHRQVKIRIKEVSGRNKKEMLEEQRYWNRFYFQFTNYLYDEKGHFDNYAGTVIKIIRTFFNYLKSHRLLQTGDFYKNFYVCKEEVPIHTLLPERLTFLITDEAFHLSLPAPLKRCKDIFVVGCTVALRFSDLLQIKPSDIEQTESGAYLSVTSVKSETVTKVKLPDYAVIILQRFMLKQGGRKRLLFAPQPVEKKIKIQPADNSKVINYVSNWICLFVAVILPMVLHPLLLAFIYSA